MLFRSENDPASLEHQLQDSQDSEAPEDNEKEDEAQDQTAEEAPEEEPVSGSSDDEEKESA